MKTIINISALHINVSEIEFVETEKRRSCHLCLFYNPYMKHVCNCKKILTDLETRQFIDENIGECFVNGERKGYYQRKKKSNKSKNQLTLNL